MRTSIKWAATVLIGCSSVFSTGVFSNEQLEARKSLVEINIPYSSEQLLKAIATNDDLALELLIKAKVNMTDTYNFLPYLSPDLPPQVAKYYFVTTDTGDQIPKEYRQYKDTFYSVSQYITVQGNALMLAALLNHEKALRLLIDTGLDVDLLGDDIGYTRTKVNALSLAIRKINPEAVQILLANNANVAQLPDEQSSTTLIQTAFNWAIDNTFQDDQAKESLHGIAKMLNKAVVTQGQQRMSPPDYIKIMNR